MRDPQLLAVTPERFAAHMEVLAHRFIPVSLDELAARPGLGGRVAVTFDDGYADNLLTAAPILARYGIPATVYAVAHNIAHGVPFWWDELETLLLDTPPEAMPATVAIRLDAQTLRFDAQQRHARDDPSWNVLRPDNPSPIHAIYRRLHPLLLGLCPEGRERALSDLRGQLGRDGKKAENRPLTPAEIAALDALPGMEIGAHTLHHPVLAALDAPRQEHEITQGAALLARMLKRDLRHFSYPYGSSVHFDEHSVLLVDKAGFVTAVTTVEGGVAPDHTPLCLPRGLIRDWNAETFYSKITQWLQ
jgi:peptidoglycan/xylan/chitin deacetylase (PgdA/CDA1 family)